MKINFMHSIITFQRHLIYDMLNDYSIEKNLIN